MERRSYECARESPVSGRAFHAKTFGTTNWHSSDRYIHVTLVYTNRVIFSISSLRKDENAFL